MGESKTRRHRAIRTLMRSSRPKSQEELVRQLVADGFSVTQATISRDLEELGAAKVRTPDGSRYSLPDGGQPDDDRQRRLSRILSEWVRTITPAANLVVVKTPPGSAHLIGVALDQAELEELAGTLCGDDTLFLATRSSTEADQLAARLRDLADL